MGNRYGEVYVSGEMIRKEIEVVAEIFAKLKGVVLRCECDYPSGNFRYIMYSPLFFEVQVGEKAPLYRIIVDTTHNDEGEITDYGVTVAVEPYTTGKQIPDSLIIPPPIKKMEVFK